MERNERKAQDKARRDARRAKRGNWTPQELDRAFWGPNIQPDERDPERKPIFED